MSTIAKSPVPTVGDEWEFQFPDKPKRRKIIRDIYPSGAYNGKLYVAWARRNKGRYTGILVERLMQIGRRLSTEAERAAVFNEQVNRRRAELGKKPINASTQ